MSNGAAVASPEGPRLHVTHVEGMRAIAALVVFLNHAYAQVWEGPKAVAAPKDGFFGALSYSMVAGHLAVAVFIVVSGFCLTLPVVRNAGVLRGGVGSFLIRRARRILPPYYAALALSLLLIWTIIGEPTGTLWDVPITVNLWGILSHVFLLQDLFGTGGINYVFWSIAVEFQLYFLFPLLVWSWAKFGGGVTVLAALAVGFALRIAGDGTRLVRVNPHFLGLFALGMLAAYLAYSDKKPYRALRDSSLLSWLALLGFIGAGALVVGDVIRFRFGYPALDLVVGVFAASTLVAAAKSTESPLTRVLSWRPLVFIGTISYSVYLIHAPVLQILWQYGFNPAGVPHKLMFFGLMTIGLAVVIALAYGFFRLFEAPFMRSSREAAVRPGAAALPTR